MKNRSLTRQLIVTVLVVEVVLAFCVTLAALYYQRREALRAFDVMLRGRADSILGSVQDAEDAADNVLLDKSSIDVPPQDRYEVREEDGRYLGSSKGPPDQLSRRLSNRDPSKGHDEDEHRGRDLEIDGIHYRALSLHGLRLIDVEAAPGTSQIGRGNLHRIVVYYAAPIRPVNEATWRATRFFLIADLAALMLSGIAVSLLIQRSLRPLEALAQEATSISPRFWDFQAPAAAYSVRELAPLAAALDAAMLGLRKAFDQQRTFVNDAAHELKTALTVMQSSLQLLSFRERTAGHRERNDQQFVEGIEMCIAGCERMADLVQRMLLLARIEHTNPSAAPPAPATNFVDIAQQVVSHLEPAASLRGIRLSVEVADGHAESLSVRLLTEDGRALLLNLLLNAIQHSPAGSTVVTQLLREGASRLRLLVIDRGEGIAAEHLPLIFQKFYRSDASRSRHTGGTGLGLAICKAIVEAAGGTISIESEINRGTTVTVVLPLIEIPVLDEGHLAGRTTGKRASIT